MKVKILESTVAGGKDLSAGKTYDIDEKDAKLLIALGKAEEVQNKKVKIEKK